ncbi:hypothetical protein [Fodinicola feengrottensis]|uniref:hypothetical protein n=1 Tax=Fodinicola feengrottensis TaxID=435914 RepID=UPI0013D0A5B9|nr:hypothetical protein [Fodinicola feengrottensis]
MPRADRRCRWWSAVSRRHARTSSQLASGQCRQTAAASRTGASKTVVGEGGGEEVAVDHRAQRRPVGGPLAEEPPVVGAETDREPRPSGPYFAGPLGNQRLRGGLDRVASKPAGTGAPATSAWTRSR